MFACRKRAPSCPSVRRPVDSNEQPNEQLANWAGRPNIHFSSSWSPSSSRITLERGAGSARRARNAIKLAEGRRSARQILARGCHNALRKRARATVANELAQTFFLLLVRSLVLNGHNKTQVARKPHHERRRRVSVVWTRRPAGGQLIECKGETLSKGANKRRRARRSASCSCPPGPGATTCARSNSIESIVMPERGGRTQVVASRRPY